jgi:DNA-binding SARP family transcriptional activator
MEFRILGPLEAREDSRLVGLAAAKQRSLVGVLLLSANTVVSSERLIEELWPREPPATALKLVQGYVSGLRKVLGATRILTQPPGYLVRVEQGELDLHEFERLVARACGETPERAADLLREALAIWRGPALVDLRLEGSAAREAERLNEQRLAALSDRIEADLALGRSADLVGELEALVAEHPLRERPRGQLMLALYRAGRQADALALYRETRTLLVEELGLEPEEELQELHRRMLAHDAELDVPRPQATVETSDHAPAAAPEDGEAEQVRRLVTVVFADLVGSTTLGERLDPESLHGVLARYSEACADVLERHGGTVEKFLGDAVVAVFGLRSVHEDDALRAARAAVELRQVAREISGGVEAEWGVRIDIKVALNSGDVFVAAAGRRGAFAGGDVLTVAAGMVQSAQGGEILLGELTRRLLEHLVSAQPVAPLAVRGRAANVQVWRLLDLLAEEPLRPAVTAFVGRERELATLKQALERAATERDCRLYTVLGPPGIGKSRLARELIAAVGDRATVVVGRCPSYGPGVTYLPLAEIVRQLGRDRVSRLAEMTEAGERAKLIADLVLGTAGLSEGQSATEDTAWAFRRLFEALAQERPLVAVFEDLHWAEPALLDLLDSLAAFSNAAPILLLCLARPGTARAAAGLGHAPADQSASRAGAAGGDACVRACRPACRCGHRPPRPDADRRDGRGESVLPRTARRRPGRKRRGGPDTEHPGAPDRAYRPARARRTHRASASVRRRQKLPSRRPRPARTGDRVGDDGITPDRPHQQAATPPRLATICRRGRLPLCPCPDPRGRLQRFTDSAPR